MSLAKRLNQMEARIRELEQWKSDVMQELAADDPDTDPEPVPAVTLDGQQHGGERDQSQPL